MPYDEEVMKYDRIYQEDSTVQNELVLEKARVKFWQKKLKEDPGNKELEGRLAFHKAEVERLEGEVKLI